MTQAVAAVAMPRNGESKRAEQSGTSAAPRGSPPSRPRVTHAQLRGLDCTQTGSSQTEVAARGQTHRGKQPPPGPTPTHHPRRKRRVHARTSPAPRSLGLYCACLGKGAALDREALAGAGQRASPGPGG